MMEKYSLTELSALSRAEWEVYWAHSLHDALIEMLGSDLGESRFDAIYRALQRTDFFTAPASTKYHEAFEGGLCLHSLRVAYLVQELNKCKCCGEVNSSIAIICALLHDVCKCYSYVAGTRNVKNAAGKWESVPCYFHNTDKPIQFRYGHGESSALWVQQMLPEATPEMLLAIRWHMGAWDCSDSGRGDLSVAAQYPLILLLQFADQLSITGYAQ